MSALGAALAARGFGVVPGFLAAEEVAALRAEIVEAAAGGSLRAAAIGRGDGQLVAPAIRSDDIAWLDEATASPAARVALDRLHELRRELNRELFLGLEELECHLARYPVGGLYAKHLDCHRDGSRRVLSIVLYLNAADWSAADGGALRLYEARDPKAVASEIAPEGGTLACFLSGEIWHEVLQPTRERFSLTGWFLRGGAR